MTPCSGIIFLLLTFTTHALSKEVSYRISNAEFHSFADESDSGRSTIGRFNHVKLWESFPKIVVPLNGTGKQCRKDSQTLMNSIDNLELWALKMLDATAKLPAGILSGNANQYGDFDECLGIDGAVKGKYCLASLQVDLNGGEKIKAIDYLLHSGHVLRSNLTDMGHQLPRYSSILWGVCIPSTCSSFDLEVDLSQKLSNFGILVRVPNGMCSVKDQETKKPNSAGKLLAITFFSSITFLLGLGTILDDGEEEEMSLGRILRAFSLRRNLKTLFDLSDAPSKIKGMDAFRGVNALALFLTHKSLVLTFNTYTNKVAFSTLFTSPWAVFGRRAPLYTDSFLYLSGFLNANNLLRDLEQKGTVSLKTCLISRWFRLFPLMFSLILFYTYILPDINNGPQWNLVIGEHSRHCERHMWKNFLFINNYFSLDDTCLPHTHQIGLVMQLYVATIPLLVIIWRYRTLGLSLLVLIALCSTVLRYLVTYWHSISIFFYYQMSLQKMMDVAQHSYILPTHRATIYVIGVVMAYFIKFDKLKYSLSIVQTRLLWLFCFALAIFTIFGPYRMGIKGYKYEHFSAAMLLAFSPILWGLALSMSHWAIHNDYIGTYGVTFIESRLFKFFTRISYSFYMTQFPVFFYNVGVQRNAEYYWWPHLFNIPELCIIVLISIITTVTITMPFENIHNIYYGESRKKLKDN